VVQFASFQLHQELLISLKEKSSFLNQLQAQTTSIVRSYYIPIKIPLIMISTFFLTLQEQLKSKIEEYENTIDIINTDNKNSITQKNHEILEIQEAYKEKLRKCQAWEKASSRYKSD
jgi:hypothetical protein